MGRRRRQWRRPMGAGTSAVPGRKASPPDLEDIIRRGQDRLKRRCRAAAASARPIIGSWSWSVSSRCGSSRPSTPCSRTNWPSNCASASRRTSFPSPACISTCGRSRPSRRANIAEKLVNIGEVRGRRDPRRSGLMLSGDQNIVDVKFSIAYQVSDPEAYLFNVSDPDGMLRQIAESAMREAVGRASGAGHLPRRPPGHRRGRAHDHPADAQRLQVGAGRERDLDRGRGAAARSGRRVRRGAARRAGRGPLRRGEQPVFQPEARPGPRRGGADPRRGGRLQEPCRAGSGG